jgi:S1-C subfamily serine protease
VKAQFKFLSGARAGQVEGFRKHYIGLGRHPLSDVRFDAERDLDVSSRHAAILVKPEGFVLQDLGSKNGTFVNGKKIEADTVLRDGDVIGFGQKGPAVEIRLLEGDDTGGAAGGSALDPTVAERAAGRASQPREMIAAQRPTDSPAVSAPRRSSTTAIRVALKESRRTTKILLVALIVTIAGFGAVQWKVRQDRARERTAILASLAAVDSVLQESRRATQQFRGQLQELRDALAISQAETERLRRQLDAGGHDATSLQALRVQLDAAVERQRGIIGAAGVDYRGIAQRNQDAVAIVLVEFSDTERFSGTAFAVDSQGTLITNKHVLVGEDGRRTPRRIGVTFSGSRQFFQARLLGVSEEADIAAIRVDIRGGTPRIAGLARDPGALQTGDPVAIIGYPLGFDLPMDRVGQTAIAAPTLTAGTVSKVLSSLVQVDGYGAPGSSGSPIFDRDGLVVGILYGGQRESQGRIIYAAPASFIVDFMARLGVRR